MTRVDEWYTTMQRWVLVPVATLMLVACSRTDQTANVAGTFAPSRTAILAEATGNYSYGEERQPITVDTTLIKAPGGTLWPITIATATQTSGAGRVPGHRFTYRLKSDSAYAAMGLAPGYNYVWRDTTTTGYRMLVVPADTTYPMMFLKRDTSVASYVPGPAPEPRLVKSAKGYGSCDNTCNPHCVSSGTLRAFTASDTLRITTGG